MSEKNLYRQRMFLYSADRASGTLNECVINLRENVTKCVSANIMTSSVAGYLLNVAEFPQKPTTSNGKLYWKFVAALTDQYYSDYHDKFWHGKNISRLTVHWMNPDGTTAALPNEWCVEVEFICEE